MDYFPTRGRLIAAWALLMALTAGTALAGGATAEGPLHAGAIAALALVTWLKAGTILRTYLNLRTAPVWADLMVILVGVLLVLILAVFALGRLH